jgi:hypothetical protein
LPRGPPQMVSGAETRRAHSVSDEWGQRDADEERWDAAEGAQWE